MDPEQDHHLDEGSHGMASVTIRVDTEVELLREVDIIFNHPR